MQEWKGHNSEEFHRELIDNEDDWLDCLERIDGTRLRDLQVGDHFSFERASVWEYRGDGWYGWPQSGGPYHCNDNPPVQIVKRKGVK